MPGTARPSGLATGNAAIDGPYASRTLAFYSSTHNVVARWSASRLHDAPA